MPGFFNRNTESIDIKSENTPGCWLYTVPDVCILSFHFACLLFISLDELYLALYIKMLTNLLINHSVQPVQSMQLLIRTTLPNWRVSMIKESRVGSVIL